MPKKIVNQKQDHNPGGIAETRATTKDLKDAGVVPYHISLYVSYLANVEDRWIMENDI